ncbi:hypothetical protein FRB93_007290 [Tulasnella sp. JGI-2019a]|nr:hypothetical protein FRB93_007290 [Tulasnella sp. JGI-2019a]
MLREVMGRNTCDMRRTLTKIEHDYPEFEVEEGFTENDELWKPDERETYWEAAQRQRKVFDTVFLRRNDEHKYVSLTSHSGVIRATLLMLGHEPFLMPIAGVIAFVVKATPVTPNNSKRTSSLDTVPCSR